MPEPTTTVPEMLRVPPGAIVTPAVLLITPPLHAMLLKFTGPDPPIDPALKIVFPVTVEALVPLKFDGRR